MATHAQIDKNINDTLDAWGQFKSFFGFTLPYFGKITLDNQVRISRAKRRF